MSLMFSSADVRVAWDGRVWVLAPAGRGARVARWAAVDLCEIVLDAAHADRVTSPYGHHTLAGLGTDAVALSHAIGLARVDVARARDLRAGTRWLRGEALAVDLGAREFTPVGTGGLVYPFSAVGAILAGRAGATLAVKTPVRGTAARLAVGVFPMPVEELAQAMGVAVVEV